MGRFITVVESSDLPPPQKMDDFSEEPSILIDEFNEGIIKCIESSGKILPSSCIKVNRCQWVEYVSADDSISCSPAVEDLRQFVDILRDTTCEHNYIGSDGRPIVYAACLGLLLSKREPSQQKTICSPLSTFLDIAEFLDDELDADFSQPTQTEGACCRSPLHLLARSCYPDAVEFLLEKISNKNVTDDEGWTPLMACCMPDIPSAEEGGPTDEERVQTTQVLMNKDCQHREGYRGENNYLDVNSQNYCGYTAMHYACEGLNAPLIKCLLDGAENVENLDLTVKTVWGESALGIVLSHREETPEKAAECEAILMSHFKKIHKSDPIHMFLEDERKSIDLMKFVNDVLIPASRGSDDGDSGKSGCLAAQDRRIITAIMNRINLDPSHIFEQNPCEQNNNEHLNIYETIYSHICELIPSALRKIYCDRNPTDEERCVVTCADYNVRRLAEKSRDSARYIDTSVLMSQAFCLHRQRGHVARQIEMLTSLFVGPLQRTLSFAIPSNDVLRQIVGFAPRIVEVGAGTGYWSHLLSKIGADVVAYDANPLGHEKGPSAGDNVYFGSLCYYPVQYGIASTIFDKISDIADRALLMIWPNNPDAIDNPLVAVAPESLPEVWDFECVQKYYEMGGKTVIFVGERKDNIKLMSDATAPDWGFCASRKFQEFLQSNYALKATLACPKWWMKEDDVTIWERP